MDRVSAGKQCRMERSINGMALQGFIFKKFFVRNPRECDISCETEITCQSYNYVLGETSCELNNRTKETRPEHFRSDRARFYIRRLSNRGMSEKKNKKAQTLRRQFERRTSNGRPMLSPKEQYKTFSFRHCLKVSVLTIYINALNFPQVMKRCFPEKFIVL